MSKQTKILLALGVAYTATWLVPPPIQQGTWWFSLYMAIWGLETSLKERAGLENT